MVRKEEVEVGGKKWSFRSQSICLDKSHLNHPSKKNQVQWSPLTNDMPYGQQKIAQGPAFIFFLLIKNIHNNVKYLPQNSQILFSSPKNFPCFEFVCGMRGLWSRWSVHTRARMASQWGVRAQQPGCLGSQSWPLPTCCGNLGKFLSLSVPQFLHCKSY